MRIEVLRSFSNLLNTKQIRDIHSGIICSYALKHIGLKLKAVELKQL